MALVAPRRSGWLVIAALAGLGGLALPSPALAAPARRSAALAEVLDDLRDTERRVVEAERAAARELRPTASELAARLVEGQLRLRRGDPEGAAIIFLDLAQNHGETPVGAQATHELGVALTALGMDRFALEILSRSLGDGQPAAVALRQRTVARMLDLAAPRRAAGFARRPGPSATPEARARLRALGLATVSPPPTGVVSASDRARLEQWVTQGFAGQELEPELRYAYGRLLYLTDRPAEARDVLDGLGTLELQPGARAAQPFQVRAAYLAAACALALGEIDVAVERFTAVSETIATAPVDAEIVELATLALGRVHHDAGEWDLAERAYRKIGRDSPYFLEGLYELAWTLLRAARWDRATQALDLLLAYDPRSPIAAEIQQLRGKIQIQRGDYPAAEAEFLALRREFSALGAAVGDRLQRGAAARDYVASVIGEDLRHFTVDAVLPARAVPIARTLPRLVQAEQLTREVGRLRDELRDVDVLLAKMEQAVRTPERARIFTDLGANLSGVDSAQADLERLREQILQRLAADVPSGARERLDTQRRTIRARLDAELAKVSSQVERQQRLEGLSEQVLALELTLAAARAQLVGAERYYGQTKADQRIDGEAVLRQAKELRDEVGALERELARLRGELDRATAGLRFTDPRLLAQAKAREAYRAQLRVTFDALRKAGASAGAGADWATAWARVDALDARADAVRDALDRAAVARLRDALAVLVEERANVDLYLAQLRTVGTTTRELTADVVAAAFGDTAVEIDNLVIRSEVGLLDVAWAMKEREASEAQRLERARDRDRTEIRTAVERGLEDLRR